MFCVAIALEREGEIVCGLVYNPILDELYTAERGQGAFLNSRRLRVAARKTLADCVISIGIPHRGRPDHPRFLAECKALMEQVGGLRRTGSAAIDLAWVASGRFDGYVERDIEPWDMAAGFLLVREAGGFVTDADGGHDMFETGSIVAGNQTVQKALLAALAEVEAGRAGSERARRPDAAGPSNPSGNQLGTVGKPTCGMILPVCGASRDWLMSPRIAAENDPWQERDRRTGCRPHCTGPCRRRACTCGACSCSWSSSACWCRFCTASCGTRCSTTSASTP